MEGKELSKKLDVKNIDFKVKQIVGKGAVKSALLLAYKDARVDMSILDDVVGVGKWKNDYKRDTKGVLQGGIAIKFDDEWVWKWSNGTESAMEKEKGEYSDAFKRAGFMWGIGRHLYDFPNIFVKLTDNEWYDKNGKATASPKLRPNDWTWYVDYEKGIIGARDTYNNVRVNEKF